MGNAIYHKSSKGRPAYIVKDGERVATFLHQPTYENGVKMARALSAHYEKTGTLEHGTPQEQMTDVVSDLLEMGKPVLSGKSAVIAEAVGEAAEKGFASGCVILSHNPRSLSHRPLGDDEFYTAHNVKL